MEKAPEGIVGDYREQQQEYDRHAPEHVDRRLPSPRPQQQHVEDHDLPPPLPYGTTTPPTASRTAPHFVTTVNSDRLENGVAHGNAKTPSHVGGRHLSPPPHPDTENDGVEAVTGDDDDSEDEDDDDIYADDVNQDHVRSTEPVAGTETKTVPTVSTGGGPAVEPSAADIHPEDEQEGHVTDKTLQKEPTRDVTGDDTGVEANAPSGGGVLAHGSTEQVHAA